MMMCLCMLIRSRAGRELLYTSGWSGARQHSVSWVNVDGVRERRTYVLVTMASL